MVAQSANQSEILAENASTGSQGSSKTSGSESGKSGKVKPSYKHIPHSQKPPHLVAKRNARERRRVQAVNQAFYKLRKSVPIENRNKRVSKVKTLQRAIDYIRKLERILAEDDEQQMSGNLNGEISTTERSAQVVNGTQNLCNERQTVANARPAKSGRKTSNNNNNCDQQDINQQPPQIMHRQKRTRQKSGKLPVQHSTEQQTAQALPAVETTTNHCQQTMIGPNELYCPTDEPLAKQSYYTSTYQQPPDAVLRESSAFNANLNHYYLNDQYATTTSTPTVGYLGEPVIEHAAAYHQHASSYYHGYPVMASGTPTTAAATSSSETNVSPTYRTSATPVPPKQQQPLALTGNFWPPGTQTGSGAQQVTPLNGSTDQSTVPPIVVAAADSSTSSTGSIGNNSSGSSLALLQSPCSTNSSSLSTTADSTQSDNSSSAPLICQPPLRNSATSVPGRPTSVGSNSSSSGGAGGGRQQVNSSYLAYANAAVSAADRMEARASHLSFAVNGSSNNDNANLPYHHNNSNNHQQQPDERRKVNSNELASTMKATGNHQVRHLLDGGNSSAVLPLRADLLANNLHEHNHQYNNYNQYHHLPLHHGQASSFPNNQHNHNYNHNHHHHLHSNHLSALQSEATNGHQSTPTNLMLLHQPQTIQDSYTNR